MLSTAGIRLVLGLLLFIIGVYLFVCAVRLKGFVYMNPPVQGTGYYDRYVRFVRVSCFVLPVSFSANLVLSIMSFAYEYKLNLEYLKNNYSSLVLQLEITSEKLYNSTTISLIVSVALIVIMLFYIAFFTSSVTSGVKHENLSGDHPAFKTDKDKE